MCVIIVKPAGVAMPAAATLQAACHANPHGCGFATPGRVFKSLSYRAFARQLAKVADDQPCIIHFRLATHGSICRRNCHPFAREDVFFAHNGILDIRPDGDKTDSETAFDKYIYPAIEAYGLDSPQANLAIKDIIGGSKFAIMQGERIRLYGSFIKDGDGCLYSNMRFMALMGWQMRYDRAPGRRCV